MADKLVDDLARALGDAYTIERELTGGGMSRVFVAKEHALGREVVIKVLPPDLAAGVNRDRFRREVQLAARLSHPYIVPLLHAGEHDELLWFTMPYIPGESLRTRLQRSGALKLPEVVRLLRDVVEALAYAHSRGVIHRDIKPGNILSDGHHALVTDFGVAKALNAALPMAGPGHTTSGMAIGTPAYMAPEQLAADPDADQRVDIYAVGLLAYELVSGVSPFAAPSPTATMTAQLTRIPEPLHQLRADVPPAFSALVQHCLAKSPDDRPPDAQAVLLELDRISGALAADVHRSTSGERDSRAHAPSLPLVLATVGVLALVAGGFWWTQRGSIKAVERGDSNATAQIGSDVGDTMPLPVKPMTHQDSLNMAEALREQLAQIDPNYHKKPVVKPKAAEPALDLVLQQTDSLLRVRLGEIYRRQIVVDSNGRVIDMRIPGSRGGRSATSVTVTAPAVPALPTTQRHLAILLTPVRRADSALRPLQQAAGRELARRANPFGEWVGVTIDSSMRMGPGQSPGLESADVLVFLTMQHTDADSVQLRVSIRSTAAGTNFGNHVLTSDPVFQPATTAPFDNTLRDAVRLLNQLRRLPPGTPWPQDMGRVTFGGPNDAGAQTFRVWSPRQLESLKSTFDSVRRYRPRHRDSMPE
jgi:tRNA A-37 threonylcarbamoyl transferase component Bud32